MGASPAPLHPPPTGQILTLCYGHDAQTLAGQRVEKQGAHPTRKSASASPTSFPPSARTQQDPSRPSPPAAHTQPGAGWIYSHIKSSDSCAGGISRAPPGPGATAGGSRAPGQALPTPTHGASRVCAPLWQFPGHGQHQQLPGFTWQRARTINTQLFLCLNEHGTLFFFLIVTLIKY